MSSFNKVILLGNLTRDPQLSYTPSNTAVVEIGIATNRKWTAQDGSQREEVCFVDCTMFGKRAEVVNQYFFRGSPIFIEGRLHFESWQAQDGTRRNKLEVMIENFQFVGSNNNQQQGSQQQSTPTGGQPNPEYDQKKGLPDDDIPF